MKKILIVLLLTLFSLNITTARSAENIDNIEKVTLFDKVYYKYTVKRRDSFKKICKKFNVTKEELIEMNPWLINDVQKGDVLLIPTKDKKNVISSKNNIYNFSSSKKRLTIILNFSGSSEYTERNIEFYQGVLLAADTLKNKGLSFEIQAIDLKNLSDNSIYDIINSGKLDNTDFCICGRSKIIISALSQWAQENNRNLIIPFTSNISQENKNSNIYRTAIPRYYMNNLVAQFITTHYSGYNFVFSKPQPGSGINTNHDLISKVKTLLNKKNIRWTEIVEDDKNNFHNYYTQLSDSLKNIIIPFKRTESNSEKIINEIGSIAKSKSDSLKIELFGYPEWQILNSTTQKLLNYMNGYIYSSFYADFSRQDLIDFQKKFNYTYDKNFLKFYPKYALLGFDIANYFIPLMSENKYNNTNIQQKQNEYNFIQSREDNNMKINTLFYFINYQKNGKTNIIENY